MTTKTKKYSYKNGKKEEREETDRERRERLMPGSDELARLSRCILEDDDDDDETLRASDDIEWFGEDDEITAAIPDKWGKLMTTSEKVREGFRIKITEAKAKRKKKLMKHCGTEGGNPYHSGKDGKFSSRSGAKSWSIRKPKTGKDCKAGLARMGSNGSELFHKHAQECGREGDWLCGEPDSRKGSKSLEEDAVDNAKDLNLSPGDVDTIATRLQKIQDRMGGEFVQALRYLVAPIVKSQDNSTPYESVVAERMRGGRVKGKKNPHRMTELSKDEIVKLCSRYGLQSFASFLQKLNAIEAAKKAELNKPPK